VKEHAATERRKRLLPWTWQSVTGIENENEGEDRAAPHWHVPAAACIILRPQRKEMLVIKRQRDLFIHSSARSFNWMVMVRVYILFYYLFFVLSRNSVFICAKVSAWGMEYPYFVLNPADTNNNKGRSANCNKQRFPLFTNKEEVHQARTPDAFPN